MKAYLQEEESGNRVIKFYLAARPQASERTRFNLNESDYSLIQTSSEGREFIEIDPDTLKPLNSTETNPLETQLQEESQTSEIGSIQNERGGFTDEIIQNPKIAMMESEMNLPVLTFEILNLPEEIREKFAVKSVIINEGVNGEPPLMVAQFISDTDFNPYDYIPDAFPLAMTIASSVSKTSLTSDDLDDPDKISPNSILRYDFWACVNDYQFGANTFTMHLTLLPPNFYFKSMTAKFSSLNDSLEKLLKGDSGPVGMTFSSSVSMENMELNEINMINSTPFRFLTTLMRMAESPSIFAFRFGGDIKLKSLDLDSYGNEEFTKWGYEDESVNLDINQEQIKELEKGVQPSFVSKYDPDVLNSEKVDGRSRPSYVDFSYPKDMSYTLADPRYAHRIAVRKGKYTEIYRSKDPSQFTNSLSSVETQGGISSSSFWDKLRANVSSLFSAGTSSNPELLDGFVSWDTYNICINVDNLANLEHLLGNSNFFNKTTFVVEVEFPANYLECRPADIIQIKLIDIDYTEWIVVSKKSTIGEQAVHTTLVLLALPDSDTKKPLPEELQEGDSPDSENPDDFIN